MGGQSRSRLGFTHGENQPGQCLAGQGLKQVERQLNELDRDRPRLIRTLAKGLIDEAEVEMEVTQIESDRESVESRRSEIEGEMASEVYFEAMDEKSEGMTTITTEEYGKPGPAPECTFEEWQALVVKHSIEIEVDTEGNVFATFEANPDVYLIPSAENRYQM